MKNAELNKRSNPKSLKVSREKKNKSKMKTEFTVLKACDETGKPLKDVWINIRQITQLIPDEKIKKVLHVHLSCGSVLSVINYFNTSNAPIDTIKKGLINN